MVFQDDDELRFGRTIGGRVQTAPGRRFAILRCAKIKTLGNMGASLQHTFRERETPNADPARIRDNTVLVGAEDSRGVLDAWRARAPEKIRVNAVHGLEYFIGGSPGALNAMSREDQDAYFRRALDWLEERHGKENVLSAVIHRDEATPHMTVMTIPLDDRGKLPVPRREVTRTLRQTEATTAHASSQQTEATVQQELPASQKDKGDDWGHG